MHQQRDALREIPGYEGRYAASADGRIWSHLRNRYLAGGTSAKGYAVVGLGAKQVKVHRAVALAWIQNPAGHPSINHKDGNKQHNAATNLEWCTTRHNILHAIRTGLSNPKAPVHRECKLTAEAASLIKARLARGERSQDLSAEFHVAPKTIRDIGNNLTWKHVAAAAI